MICCDISILEVVVVDDIYRDKGRVMSWLVSFLLNL